MLNLPTFMLEKKPNLAVSMSQNFDAIVVGGGAAGFFAAIQASAHASGGRIAILEAGGQTLSKVAISGGGRCNVTHSCFDCNAAIAAYPRGAKELRSAFSRFQALDTIDWFNERGVQLKTEADGRVFPSSDSSQTIIECLENAARKAGVFIFRKTKARTIQHSNGVFLVSCGNESCFASKQLLLASGGTRQGFNLAASLGHSITQPVPSLFTFKISDRRLTGLSGVSVKQGKLILSTDDAQRFVAEGPLLITHWGLSGPAVLKISAWAARALFEHTYRATLRISWLDRTADNVLRELLELKQREPRKNLRSAIPAKLPKRLWLSVLEALEFTDDRVWAGLSKKECNRISEELTGGLFKVTGKGAFKDEFVTCGGVRLNEVDFRTMESKLAPGLYFAGEILDIDGLTGGYNFQAAWSTGYIAGCSIGNSIVTSRGGAPLLNRPPKPLP